MTSRSADPSPNSFSAAGPGDQSRAAGTHPAGNSNEQLLQESNREQLRRSGPGGQRRNKVETGIRLTHRPTGVVAEAFEQRSLSLNLHRALDRLRRKLALAIRCPPAQQPSELWRSRSGSGRIRISPDHRDLPALVAEALDMLAAEDWQVSKAAVRLAVSASQLVRLLSLEPEALALLNSQRREAGLPPLKR